MSALSGEHIVTGYGKQEVVHGVSVRARAGEITCIFGPNGSGKSTLIKALAGSLPVWRGRVHLDGTDLTRLPVHRVVQQGVVMMPQGGGLFARLSVIENLRMGGYALAGKAEVEARAERLLGEYPALAARRRAQAGSLSGGEQMMLALARALVSSPSFVLLDEPSAGLAPSMVSSTLERVQALKARGVGVILVEQNIREALPIADQLYILTGGEERFHGTPREAGDDHHLMAMYMGGG
jgi:branched-chain amino acid transport system ATP-binding protein